MTRGAQPTVISPTTKTKPSDSLDLETFRAFRQRPDIITVWNDSVSTLLTRTDRQKQGQLKIGLALPSAVESIVGEGGAGLKVSGYQRIGFSGRSQWTDGASVSTVKPTKFPSLKMDQINRFSVEGTVGSKISVSVDQDSRRTTDLENRILVRYRSDDDDIIQSIDLGNTNLAISDAKFIGYSERIQGLFGIGVAGKVGPMDWKMIASQEKGNTSRSRLTAGANEQTIYIRDYQFDRYRFFDVGKIGGVDYLADGDSIVFFRLYQDVGNYDATQPEAIAFPDVNNPEASPDSVVKRFRELSSVEDYTLEPAQHFVFFPTRLQNIQTTTLAYHMVVRRPDGTTYSFGDISSSVYRLQMLKRQNPQPSDPLWEAEWKNVYDLRIRDIKYEDLDLKIYKGALGDEANAANLDHQSGTNYLRIFELDKNSSTSTGGPDNKVDDNQSILFLEEGLLVFPNRFPFADTDSLLEKIPTLYTSANQNDLRDSSKYYLQLTSRQRSRSVRLNTVNLLENSEVVTRNGVKQTRGFDYDIDYTTGEVTFLRDEFLDPNATVTIDYEYAPFISAEKRTLFGLSTKFEPSTSFRSGATVLYKGTKATNRPAQLGAEPYRDLVGEYFVNFTRSVPVFTKLADAFPLIDVEAPSNLSFQGAVARSIPNPNTRGDVFIDDFEGAKRAQSLGVVRESWTIAAPPLNPLTPTALLPTRNELHDPSFRGLHDPAFIWFNPYTQFEDIDIYERDPNRNRSSDRRTHVLVGEFRPQSSTTKLLTDANAAAWGGIMRGLPVSAWDQSRAEYLEVRMAVVRRGSSAGRLHIDLGRVSEDVNNDGALDTEDKARGPEQFRNKILEDDEDVGLDGLPDIQEVSADGTPYDPVSNPDPASDNWQYDNSSGTRNDYNRINGTDKSLTDPVRGLRPDTEDLGGESEFDRINAYYELSIDLDAAYGEFDPALIENTDKVSADVTGYASELTWKTYRIPLWESAYYQVFSDPGIKADSNQIQYARLWISDADSTTRVYIAAIDIVERTWKAELVHAAPVPPEVEPRFPKEKDDRDRFVDGAGVAAAAPADFQVGVKNTEENLDYFSPPGVAGYRDPATNYREKEQSLILRYQNFRGGDEGKASITVAKEDLTGYRSFEMWVHADESVADGKTMFYMRFGQNSQNYYEYSDTLVYDPDVAANWTANAAKIDFNQITALKDTARCATCRDTVSDPFYKTRVVGAPSLANVIYREIGIVRLGEPTSEPVSGEIWCDELRLTDVRKDPGLAGSARMTVSFSDFIGVSANIDHQTYSFRQLNQARSSVQAGYDKTNAAANGNIALDKFLPEALGVTLPVSVTYSRDLRTPRLLTGSDIVLTKDRQVDQQSLAISQGFSTSFLVRPKGAPWWVNATLGSFSSRFSATRQRSWTPTTPETEGSTYNASADYRLAFKERLTFTPLFWTRYLLFPRRIWGTPLSMVPNDFRAQGSINRSRSFSINSLGQRTDSYSRTFTGGAGTNLTPIPALSVRYDMTSQRDLSDAEDLNLSFSPSEFRFGRELGFTQNASASYKPSIVSFLAPTLSYTTAFNDKIDRVYADHDVSGTRNWSINGSFDPAKFWTFLGARQKQGRSQASGRDAKAKEDEARKVREAREALDAKARARAEGDTTQAAEPAKPSEGGAAPLDAWRGLVGALRWITSPIGSTTLNYGRTETDTRQALAWRPSWRYLFGVDLDPEEVPISTLANPSLTNVNSQSERQTFSAKNQINLFNLLSISNGYTFNRTTTIKAGSRNWSEGTVFPSLSTGLQRLERIPPFGWIYATASVRFGYEEKLDESFQLPTGLLNSTTTKSFTPLVQIQGTTRNGIATTLTYDQGTAQGHTVTSRTFNRKEASNLRVTSNYSFTSPYGIPLPLLRGIRLRSQMTISLAVSYRVDRTFTRVDNLTGDSLTIGQYNLTGESSVFTVSPQASYSFSLRVKGGMTAEWSDRDDHSPTTGRRKSHVRSLGLWAEFSF